MATASEIHHESDDATTKESKTSDSSTLEEEMKREPGVGEDEIEPPKSSLQQWNSPNINKYRYLGANYSFIIMGMNDAAYGVCLSFPPLFSPEDDPCIPCSITDS